LLKYKQAIDDRRTCCVSFASMVFDVLDPTLNAGEADLAAHA
jgi:hypothetical protein